MLCARLVAVQITKRHVKQGNALHVNSNWVGTSVTHCICVQEAYTCNATCVVLTGSSHGSRPSSRASSRSSRPPSVCSDVSEEGAAQGGGGGGGPDVFTTMHTETRVLGGRPTTTVTYQTHQTQTRAISHPTHTGPRVTSAGGPGEASRGSDGQATWEQVTCVTR